VTATHESVSHGAGTIPAFSARKRITDKVGHPLFTDPLLLDMDGGTTDRTFNRRSDGIYIASDSTLGAPHVVNIRHKAFKAAAGNVDQHTIEILRSEEDTKGTLARCEFKLTVNVPQKVITEAHLDEVRYQLTDFLLAADSWARFLRSET